jgi:hypothetical protein
MQKLLPILGLIAILIAPLAAQETPSKNAPARSNRASTPAKGAKEEKVPGFTLEREAAALSFVEQHHPELGDLLTQLKNSSKRGYQQAINELFRASERLATSKERDPVRHELELRVWKLDSRIRLLAARMSMTDSQAMQEELRALLLEKSDVQLEQKLLDRERLVTRLEKLDAAIQKARNERDEQAQRSLDALLKDIKQSQPQNRTQQNRQQQNRTERSGAVPAKSLPETINPATTTAATR